MKKLLLFAFGSFLSFLGSSQVLNEGFENGVPPAGWIYTSDTIDVLLASDPGESFEGTTAALFDDVSGHDTSFLITPMLTSLPGNQQLSFYQDEAYSSSFYVYHGVWISTTDTNPSSFTEVSEILPPTSGAYEEVTLDLSSYAGQNIYLAFVYVGDFADEWYVDAVSVDSIPPCPNPTSVTANAIDGFSAEISWDGPVNAVDYIVEYDTTGFAFGTGLISSSTSNSVVLTGLSPETVYDFTVTANCGVDGSSAPTIGGSFETLESCPGPVSGSILSINSNSIDLEWVAGPSETEWLVEWGEAGFTQGSGTTANVMDTSYTVTGLSSLTSYDVYIYGLCAAGDTSEAIIGEDLFTPCDPNNSPSSVSLPYSEDFNSASACDWMSVDQNNDSITWVVSSIDNSNKAMRISYNSTQNMNDWLISPSFSLSSGDVISVGFNYASSTSYVEDFSLSIASSSNITDLQNAVVFDTSITGPVYADGAYKSVVFTAPADGDYNLGFHGYSAADQFYIIIDNISVVPGVDPTGVKNSSLDNINVYPNPTTDLITLSFGELDVKTVNLKDVSGRFIDSYAVNTNQLNINLETLATGIYQVEIVSNKGSYTKLVSKK